MKTHDKIFYAIILIGFLVISFDVGRMYGESKFCKTEYSYDYGVCK